MMRILRFLITGDWHVHHWKVFDQATVVDSYGISISEKYYLRCEHCGNIKIKKG